MKNMTYVNLTGAKSFTDIKNAVKLLKEYSKIKEIFNLKVDSISLVESQSNLNFEDFIGNDNYILKIHPRFGGKTVKSKKYRVAVNIFSGSRKSVYMGLKSVDHINIFR